jgi:hypothetical protein
MDEEIEPHSSAVARHVGRKSRSGSPTGATASQSDARRTPTG